MGIILLGLGCLLLMGIVYFENLWVGLVLYHFVRKGQWRNNNVTLIQGS